MARSLSELQKQYHSSSKPGGKGPGKFGKNPLGKMPDMKKMRNLAIVIIVALAVLWMPATLGAEAVILFVAVAFVSYGVSMVTLAFRLLDIHRYAKRLGAEK